MAARSSQREFCAIADDACEAPAGFGISGMGWARGKVHARFTCGGCDRPVCGKCSQGRGKARRCNDCREEEGT